VISGAETERISASLRTRWEMIDIRLIPKHLRQSCVRLNALGSLFYFSKAILNYKDLTANLHWYMCSSVEKEELNNVFEYPRGHFKSTIYSISTPMWWALPFDENDEGLMRGLGYGDEGTLGVEAEHFREYRLRVITDRLERMPDLIDKLYKRYGA